MIGFLVWGHHMFVTGQSMYASMVFSLLSFLVAVPSAIKVFNWTATMYRGSIRYDTPMLYAFGFIGLFTIGGLTGLFLATLAVDVHLTDTYFVVAHFHYVMVGGMVMAYMGGLHFWWPKITGRMYPEGWAKFAALVVFVGFNLTFFPQFILGYLGHAAPLSRLRAGVSGVERDVHGGRVDSGRRLSDSADLSDLVVEVWHERRQQSVGRDGPGMADHFAAAHVQFRQDSDRDRGSLRILAQEGGGSWLTLTRSAGASRHDLQHHFDDMEQQFDSATLGMWVFLLTEIMFFGGMFGAYTVYRDMYPEAFASTSKYMNTCLGAVNTAVLICSSLTMALAVRSAQIGQPKRAASGC